MTWLAKQLAPIWGWLVAAAAAIVAFLAILGRAKNEGRTDERNRAQEADRERANQIRDAVDAARRGGGLQPDDRGYRD
jgi:hypothetical protein